MSPRVAERIPNHFHTSAQRPLETSQCKNKCNVVSGASQPAAQVDAPPLITPRRNKLSLVDNLFRRRCHTNKDTFDGICFSQDSLIE